jgi:hypothetical protein
MKYMASEEPTEVQSRLLLDVIIRKGTAVLELLPRKDETLLVRWDTVPHVNVRRAGQ